MRADQKDPVSRFRE